MAEENKGPFNQEVRLRVQELQGGHLSILAGPNKGDSDEYDSLEAIGHIVTALKQCGLGDNLRVVERNVSGRSIPDFIRINVLPRRFTESDFFVGTICALITRGRERFFTVQDDFVHDAFLSLFENELQEEAEKNNLDIRFPLKLNQFYGTSQTVFHGLGARVGNILSVEMPGGMLLASFTPGMAEKVLQRLPGTPEMYKRLAARFEELLHA